MSTAKSVLQGAFGRVALLDMDRPLVVHAHHHCHILLKSSGADTYFGVRDGHYPLTDETAVLINAWEPHYYNHRPNAPRTMILAMYIEPRWLAEVQPPFIMSGHPRFFRRPCVRLTPDIRRMIDHLSLEMSFGALADDSEVQRLILNLTVSIIHQFSEWREFGGLARKPALSSDYRVRRVIDHMRDNPSRATDSDHLASVAGLSRARFFQCFRGTTGLTPGVFGNMILVENAISRLTKTPLSIQDIAFDLGFSAQSNFARFFGQHVGCSPSVYRRKVDLVEASAAQGPH